MKFGLWLIFYFDRWEEFRVKVVMVVIFIVFLVLVEFGYMIGISKLVLYFMIVLEYLGFLVDFVK